MSKNWVNQLKKVATVGLAGLVLAACGNGAEEGDTSSGGESAAAGDDSSVKFGLITAQTGGASAYGVSIEEGAQLAVDEINEANPDHQIEFIVEDEKGEKDEAINAMNKLIHQDQVLAVQGPMLTGTMNAAGPVANDAGVVALGTSTTGEGITDIGEYIFRNAVPESTAVAEAVRQAHEELGFETAAILYSQNNDQMVSVNNTLEQTFEELGVEVVVSETFSDGDTDFSAQLTNIQSAEPDVVAVASLLQEGSVIMTAARDMGLEQPVIGSNGFNSPAFIEQSGEAADGAVVGTPWFPGRESETTQNFNEAYETAYGRSADQFAAQSYDGIHLLYQAWVDSGYTQDRTEFRDALANVSDFEGVTGPMSFDENRDPVAEVQVLKVEGGEFVPLSE